MPISLLLARCRSNLTISNLMDGRHIPIYTTVTPGSGQVIQFVTAADGKKKEGVKGIASDKAAQAKEEAKRQWDIAMKQVHEPGKIHKIIRYAVAAAPCPSTIY